MKRLLNQFQNWKVTLQRLLLAIVAVLLASQTLASPANATSVYEIPDLTPATWVFDKAEILSRLSEGKISSDLETLARNTGYEVRFVTIHRLDYGETAQSFADKLFERWFPTPESQANQVILVIDSQTNNTGIRTGAKVKEVMPDEIAQSVAQETVLVPLKQGERYNQAFLEASDRLVAVLSGRPDPGPPVVEDNIQVEGTFATPEETKSSNATFWVITFLVVATIVPMATYYFYLYMQER
ncbi:photosystem II repair protein Psb32 [Leptothermofonsia sp. ETS-13]|uniref:photosystem II repair protein Psb32 n=1 Tax=Leptothermofonsia sp. ETS-13 TaxID=3035696 RepID=UPI003B9E45D6